MQRYYYIDESLDELEIVEKELESAGIPTEQIHVLSHSDGEVAMHRLHSVTSIMKKDLVHSTIIGAIIGIFLSILVLVGAWLTGWPETYTWVPFVFLAIVVLGFSTWEGGLWGIQEPNHHFRRFENELKQGKHVLFVDIDSKDSDTLRSVAQSHPRLQSVGKGKSMPKAVVMGQQLFHRFTRWAP